MWEAFYWGLAPFDEGNSCSRGNRTTLALLLPTTWVT